MANRLADETSPYLLQHAHNPVDWYPWGPEALERAKAEDRPILLSIGYAACHWCHVMERESFEDEETARLMNERFVNIKVDREERPDLDNIYMTATQAMTGHGGWPMTVFLTPDGAPFYAGTYFPPEDRQGMPSFRKILTAVANAYHEKRGSVESTAKQIRDLYAASSAPARSSGQVSAATLERGARAIAGQYDPRYGGFSGAPKFPQTMAFDFLLRHWRRTGSASALEMARDTFLAIARGGIHDQVGGGFHRYSVDAHWLVPHFEKMLYDNALLARLGVHLWQATGDEEIRRATEQTFEWLRREMTSPTGGFYSSLDADSEGHEGKFYVWSRTEMAGALADVLGPDAELVLSCWGITEGGNFEGANIPHVPNPRRAVAARAGVEVEVLEAAVDRARATLYDIRARRVWPGRDEKVLAAWNGLMLRAVADGARILGDDGLRTLALANGEFLLREMVRDGRVMRSHKDGVTRIAGFLEDHAAVALAFLDLHALTFDRRWLDAAARIADATVEWFWDDEAGAFFDTARDHETLVTRPRDITDNAVPSGNSLAVELLLRLSELRHDEEMARRAAWVLETLAEPMARHGSAFGHLLAAADMAVHGATAVALVGDPRSEDFRALAGTIARAYAPALVLAGGPPSAASGIGLLEDRPARDGRATAYVCRRFVCDAPTTEPEELGSQVERSATGEWAMGNGG